MFIVDAHEDIASNVLHHGRDIRRPLAYIRRREDEIAAARGCPLIDCPDLAMLSLPEHRSGGVGLVFATIFTLPGALETVVAKSLEQMQYYTSLSEEEAGVRVISSRSQLKALQEDWRRAETSDDRPVGMVLLMEGADPLRDPDELEEWHRQGLRIIGPSWHGTRYAGGTGAPGGVGSVMGDTPSTRRLARPILSVRHRTAGGKIQPRAFGSRFRYTPPG